MPRNLVTVPNNSLMLPGGAKLSRSDSNGLCVCSCPEENAVVESLVRILCFGTLHPLPSVFMQ